MVRPERVRRGDEKRASSITCLDFSVSSAPRKIFFFISSLTGSRVGGARPSMCSVMSLPILASGHSVRVRRDATTS